MDTVPFGTCKAAMAVQGGKSEGAFVVMCMDDIHFTSLNLDKTVFLFSA